VNPAVALPVRYPQLRRYLLERTALSDTASHDKRVWIAIAIVLAVAITVAVIVALASHEDPASDTAPPPTTSPASPSPPALRQAKWHIRTFPAVMRDRMTKKHRRSVRTQGLKASRGIERVYNALFLAPVEMDHAVRSHFEQKAGRAFLRAKIGLPRRLRRVQITHRSIRLGIDAGTSKNAIATVKVLLKGVRGSTRLKIQHQSTLWLERLHRSWKILAFNAQQEPQ
jgi:hypothetical protein